MTIISCYTQVMTIPFTSDQVLYDMLGHVNVKMIHEPYFRFYHLAKRPNGIVMHWGHTIYVRSA